MIPTPEQKQLALRLYQEGQSIYDVARELGCAPQSVHKWLVAAGVPRRSKAEGTQRAFEKSGRGAETRQHRAEVKVTKDALVAERAAAVERYLRGESASAIGRSLGRPTITISNWLKAASVEQRSLSDACRRHTLNERAFEVIETDAQAYWLGFLTADGGVNDRGELCVNLQLRDKGHLERLREFLGASYEVKEAHVIKPGYERHSAYLDVTSRQLCADLLRHGVGPQKSETCRFNQELPDRLYGAYVRGLFDGDGGWCALTPNQTQWALKGNEQFLVALQSKMVVLVKVNHTKLGTHHTTPWLKNLCYGGIPQALRISKWMYSNATIFLPRKLDVFLEHLGTSTYHQEKYASEIAFLRSIREDFQSNF